MLASVRTIAQLIAGSSLLSPPPLTSHSPLTHLSPFADEVDAGIPSERIIVGGFSQGQSRSRHQPTTCC